MQDEKKTRRRRSLAVPATLTALVAGALSGCGPAPRECVDALGRPLDATYCTYPSKLPLGYMAPAHWRTINSTTYYHSGYYGGGFYGGGPHIGSFGGSSSGASDGFGGVSRGGFGGHGGFGGGFGG